LEAPGHPSLTGAWASLRTTVIAMCAFGLLAAALTRLVRSPAIEDQPRLPGFPLRP